MKNTAFYISIFCLSAALVGCSGGNSGAISGGGKRCEVNGDTNPIPIDSSAQKVSMKSDDKNLAKGIYVYNGSQLYYYDSSTKTQIHLAEDANFKTSVVCMRNLPATSNTVEEGTIASSLTVKNNVVDFDVRNLIFTFGDQKITLVTEDAKPEVKAKFKTAEEVFTSTKGTRMQFYKTSDTTYEARTSVSNGPIRKDIIVFYTLKK